MSAPRRLELQPQVSCPSCWARLDPADLLWVAAHPDLRGDDYLGDDAQRRFLPTRFDAEGFALDSQGLRCQTLACPSCRLAVPRILVELKAIYVSVIGTPSSGKSYFLASTTWQARRRLRQFGVSFSDADPVANQILCDYERKLFLNDHPERFVAIPKTEEDGELYQSVNYGTRREMYARPFVFAVRPDADHPLVAGRSDSTIRLASRALCLYDNAGEHFQPRAESALSPATDHLALSQALIFLFDPLQHPKFRTLCRKFSSDPQLGPEFGVHRQDDVLLEAAKRIRQKGNLPQHRRVEKPLIVAVNKYDVWKELAGKLELARRSPFIATAGGVAGIDASLVTKVSSVVQQLLAQTAPEFVAACESFSDDVTYIPISPQGCSPELADGSSKLLGVRPERLRPIWAEVPLLYALGRSDCRVVTLAEGKSPSPATQ